MEAHREFENYKNEYGFIGMSRPEIKLVNGKKQITSIFPKGHGDIRVGDDKLKKLNERKCSIHIGDGKFERVESKTFILFTGNRGDEEKAMTVIDFDSHKKYEEFEKQCPDVKDRLQHITKNGRHIFYKYNSDLKQTQDKESEIDCRNDGGLIFSYPTVYYDESNTKYEYKKSDGYIKEMTLLEKQWFKDNNVKIFKNDIIQGINVIKDEAIPDHILHMDSLINPINNDDVIPVIPKNNKVNKKFAEMEFYYNNGLFDNIFKPQNKNAYKEWGLVGCVFKHEFEKQGKELLYKINVNKYPELHNEEGFEANWNSWRYYSTITLGSVKYWLRRENPEQYKKLQQKWSFNNLNLEDEQFTTGLLTDYFEELYPASFIYQDKKLYFWNSIYWEKENDNMSNLTKFVDKNFFRNLLEYHTEKDQQLKREYIEDLNCDTFKLKARKLNKFLVKCSQLRCVSWRSGLIKDILTRITDDNILLDDNDFQFVFKNCVIDLKTNEKITPNPFDYNTICCGYDYQKVNKTKNDYLANIIKEIHPKPVMRNWFYLILSTGLCGKQLQNMFFFQGVGGNGKSVMDGLMLKTCGGYGIKIPSKFFLQDCDMKPLPEIANCHNKRFILSQEPNNKKQIVGNVLKEWTGDTKFSVRTIYSDKSEITLKGTNIMEVNDLVNINETTNGINRRLKFCRFESKAVEKDEYKTLDADFIKSNNIIVKNSYFTESAFQDEYKMEFFHLIMENGFKTFVENKTELIGEPNMSRKDRDTYMEKNDFLYSWFLNTYEPITDKDTEYDKYIIKLTNLHKQFLSSDDFSKNLNRTEKKDFKREADFRYKIRTNLFLGKKIKEDTTWNNIKIRGYTLVGFKRKVYNLDEIDEEE